MRLRLLLASACMSAACAASETGNPVEGQTLSLTARSSDAHVSAGEPKGAAADVTVSAAWIVIKEVRFVRSAVCDRGQDAEVSIEGPIVAELVAEPTVLDLAVEDASYCRVRAPLDRAERVPDFAPDELQDAAIVVEGTRSDGTPFVIRSEATPDAELRSRGAPFSLSSARASLVLAFDLGRWLQGVDLDAAKPDARGVVRIDDDHHRALLDRFEDNVEAAMELFDDVDHDGELSETEIEDVLAGGD